MLTVGAYVVGLGLGYLYGRKVERRFWLDELDSLIQWAENKVKNGGK